VVFGHWRQLEQQQVVSGHLHALDSGLACGARALTLMNLENTVSGHSNAICEDLFDMSDFQRIAQSRHAENWFTQGAHWCRYPRPRKAMSRRILPMRYGWITTAIKAYVRNADKQGAPLIVLLLHGNSSPNPAGHLAKLRF